MAAVLISELIFLYIYLLLSSSRRDKFSLLLSFLPLSLEVRVDFFPFLPPQTTGPSGGATQLGTLSPMVDSDNRDQKRILPQPIAKRGVSYIRCALPGAHW